MEYLTLSQAAGKFEVEENNSAVMSKQDPTGEERWINIQVVCCDWYDCSALTRLGFRLNYSADNMTGMVGTALYVSPEVQGNTKATYNQVRLSEVYYNKYLVYVFDFSTF